MLSTLLLFGRKYLFEILIGVAALLAAGYATYKAQNWCNHACRTAIIERDEARANLTKCQENAEKEMAHFLTERAGWQKQVEDQAKAVKKAKAAKAKIVDDNRRKFDDIFTERKKNEAQSKERIVAQIRPSAVVTAPSALVREYNEAVANGTDASTGGRRAEVRIPNDSAVLVGEIESFDAVAVAEALIGNVHKYNELALRCDTLVEIVKQLEEKYGHDPNGTVGKTGADGGNVLDGAVRDQIF